MVTVNGTNHNGCLSTTGHMLDCPSDHPIIDITPCQAKAGWRSQFAVFTHNLSWVDSDGVSHSLTLRSDSLPDLMADIKTMKSLIRQSKAQHQAKNPAAQPETQPERVICKIHNVEMERRVSKHTGGHYHCHRLAGNDLCFGRERKA